MPGAAGDALSAIASRRTRRDVRGENVFPTRCGIQSAASIARNAAGTVSVSHTPFSA